MNIIWHEAAQTDLREAVLYLRERNPSAARKLYSTIRQRVARLADYPNRGRPGRVPNTRELVLSGTRYLVAYTVDMHTSEVIILRVLHGRQEWPEEFEN